MTVSEAIAARHSVRQYSDRKISAEAVDALNKEIAACNAESKLKIRLITDEPTAFDTIIAKYGKFSGVTNYIAVVGKKGDSLDERCGYYGQRLVLFAQSIGLNTCWVALTFSQAAAKKHVKLGREEKLVIVIAVGYGCDNGIQHESKALSELCPDYDGAPDWYKAGVDAAVLAPTALNQQQFKLELCGDKVKAENLGGFFSEVDLGIVKYNFEAGSGKDHDIWL